MAKQCIRLGLLSFIALTSANTADAQDAPLEEALAGLSGATTQTPDALAATLMPRLGQAMGLAPKHAVTVQIRDRSTLRNMLIGVLRRQYPGDTLSSMGQAYGALGLVPRDTNLEEAALALYSQQIAGYYDPYSGVLALVRDASTAQRVEVLQHELAHALQDQHYPLQKLIDAVAADDDRALALQAVVEGQAMVAMFWGVTEQAQPMSPQQARAALHDAGMDVSDDELATLVGAKSGDGTQELSVADLVAPDAPASGNLPYLAAQMTFPYREGTRFVENLVKRDGFPKAVRRSLSRPPASTHQVLHPEAYLHNEQPVAIAVEKPFVSRKAAVRYATTVGEANVRTLLTILHCPADAAAAWRGDRLVMADLPQAGPVTAWVSLWQTEEAAGAIAQALGNAPGQAWVRQRQGRVVLVVGGPKSTVREIGDAMLSLPESG